MPRLLIDVECNKKTCGKCRHKNPYGNRSRFSTRCRCKIFNIDLKVKINKSNLLSFYRLKECIQAEKDYIELLMEGWAV